MTFKQDVIKKALQLQRNHKGFALPAKAMGLIGGIIGLVVLLAVVIAVEPTATTQFNAWNASNILPFGSLFENGLIFWLLVAVASLGAMFAVAKFRS